MFLHNFAFFDLVIIGGAKSREHVLCRNTWFVRYDFFWNFLSASVWSPAFFICKLMAIADMMSNDVAISTSNRIRTSREHFQKSVDRGVVVLNKTKLFSESVSVSSSTKSISIFQDGVLFYYLTFEYT
jgi:hypothetical protein